MLKRMLFSILVLGGLFGLEAAVPEKPVGVNVTSITSTSLNVTVTLQPGQYDGIKVELSNSGTVVSVSSKVQAINPTNNSPVALFMVQFTEPLIPGQHYSLTIFSTLNGNFSEGFAAGMITVPPATPTSPRINSLTSSAIDITVFLPVGDYDKIFVELLNEGIRESSGFSTRPRFNIGVGSDTSFNFIITPPPTPGSQYSARVKSESGLKESDSVDAGMITVAPAPPSSATVTSISTSEIKLTVNFNPGDRSGITVELSEGVNLVSTRSTTIDQATGNLFIVPLSSELLPGRRYTVKVKTVSGTESSTAVEATGKNTVPPTPPSSATVTSISTRQIELTVNFNAGDHTGITVELSYGGNPVSTGSATINQATGNQFTVVISPVLVPGRQYTVTVKTVSGNESSTAVEATGENTVPPAPPSSATVTSISTGQIELTVDFNAGDRSGITVELSDGVNPVSTGSATINQATGNQFTVVISPVLVPGRQYTVTVKTVSGNESSTALEATGEKRVHPARPTSITVSSISITQITVNVQLPQGDYDGITVELYNGANTESTGSSSRQVLYVDSSQQKVYTINLNPELVPGRQYSVRVKSRSGTRESSTRDAAGTSTVTPAPPSSATVTSISTGQIELTVEFNAGDRTGITVELSDGMNPVSTGSATINQATGNQFTVPISSVLVPGRQYTVTVKTVSGAEFSTAVEATGKNRVSPAPPSSATVRSISTGQIRLTVDFQSGDRTGITVELSDGMNPVSTRSATINQATHNQFIVPISPDLVPGRQYTVTVKTVSGNEFSTTVEATGNNTVPPAPPSSVTVTSISTDQIGLTVDFNAGDRSGITVELSGEGQVSTGSTTIATNNQFTVTISSELVPGRHYNVTVKTVSGAESSTAVQATGKITVPLSDLTTVSVTSISTTHIGLRVFMPKGHYDNLTADIVYGQTVSTGVSGRGRFLIVPGSEQNFYFPISPHLIPGRQYSVKVTSMSGSVSSNTVDFPASRLTRVAPAQPTSITVSSISTTQITVNVQLPQGDYDGITVELYNGGSTESSGSSSGQVSSEQKVYTIDLDPSLVPGRQYSVRVKSRSGTKESLIRDAALRSTVKPSTPVAVSTLAITTSSVTLEITFGSGEYTGIIVELHGTDEETILKFKSVSYTQLPTKNVTVNGLSLTAGNKYSVKVQASSGNKVSDQKESSNSLRIVPSTPTIESVEASTGDMSIRVGVKKGPGITPFILVRISRGSDWSRETRLDVQNNGEAEHSFGQLESGNYHVTVKAQSGDLNSTTSSITTIALEPPPVNVTVKSRTSRSLELNWRRDDLNVKSFRLVVNESNKCLQEIYLNERNYQRDLSNNGCPQSSLVFEETTTDISYNITQLLPYTLYGLEIYITSGGIAEKPEPSTLSKRTETEVPSKLNITHVSVDGSRNATVCWTRPDPFPGPTEYMITVVDQGDPKLQDISSVLIGFNQTCKNLSDLEEFWPYSVKVLANTSAGDGPVTESIVFKTNESVPGDATNFMVNGAVNDPFKAHVTWSPPSPRDRNANITGFQLTVEDLTDKAPKENRSVPWSMGPSYFLNVDVVPEKLYNFTIISVGVEFLGGKNSYEFIAPAGKPLTPKEGDVFVNPSGQPQNSLKSVSVNIKIDFFSDDTRGGITDFGIVLVKKKSLTESDISNLKSDHFTSLPNWYEANRTDFEILYRATPVNWRLTDNGKREKRESVEDITYEIGSNASCGSDKDGYCNGPLRSGTTYSVSAFSCTSGGCTQTEYVDYATKEDPPNLAWIAGLVCGVAAFIIVVIVIVLVRKRRQKLKKPVDIDSPSTDGMVLDDIPEPEPDHPKSLPIQLSDFISSVQEMHKDANIELSSQYSMLKDLSPKLPVTSASMQENRVKNRYTDVVAFDSTRVKLVPIEDDESSDYINANYIPGYNSRREYIASQGPLPSTIDDFWRMVWEQKVQIIIMVTNLKEKGQVKCEKYWPDESEEDSNYGSLNVKPISSSSMNSYDLREFKVSWGDSVRVVKQFHFLKWPDFGVSTSEQVVSFIHDFRGHIPPDMNSPILIHCSAGVGRTGTLIALDQITQNIYDTSAGDDICIDIYKIVLTMRHHRPRMVQTEAQYIFIHDAVCEIIEDKRRKEQTDPIYTNQAFQDEAIYQNGAVKEENIYENIMKG